ncbi:MAG: TatD family hydrolase [Candidatus Rifleibacteriota bacterium]
MTKSFLIDVHAHLQDEKFADEHDLIIKNALQADVCKIINAGTCLETSQQAINLADKYECCYAAAGIHPHDSETYAGEPTIAKLKKMLQHPRVVALGEIGLDFYYDFSSPEKQKETFSALWQLATEMKVPVVVHLREAFETFFDIIKELPCPPKVLLHCFSGDVGIAGKAADMGFHFSIGGILTFPNSDITRDVFTFLPDDLIHLESDCPYLAPKPKRGKRNEPAYIKHTFEFLCQLRRTEPEQLKSKLQKNAQNLFGSALT